MDHFLQINSAIERSKDLFGRHVKAFVRVAGRLQQGGGGQSRRLLHLYPHDRRGLRRLAGRGMPRRRQPCSGVCEEEKSSKTNSSTEQLMKPAMCTFQTAFFLKLGHTHSD